MLIPSLHSVFMELSYLGTEENGRENDPKLASVTPFPLVFVSGNKCHRKEDSEASTSISEFITSINITVPISFGPIQSGQFSSSVLICL